MSRINIDEKFKVDPRFIALCSLIQRHVAFGVVICLWELEEVYWKNNKAPIPKALAERLPHIAELRCVGLAIDSDEGVFCPDAKERWGFLFDSVEKGRAGGLASAEARLKKYGSSIPVNATNQAPNGIRSETERNRTGIRTNAEQAPERKPNETEANRSETEANRSQPKPTEPSSSSSSSSSEELENKEMSDCSSDGQWSEMSNAGGHKSLIEDGVTKNTTLPAGLPDRPPPAPMRREVDDEPEIHELALLWNACVRSLPKVSTTSGKRLERIRKRMRERASLGEWRRIFHRVEKSDFLSGRSGDWTACSFDWVLGNNKHGTPNHVAIDEGVHDNRGKSKQKSFTVEEF